MPVLHFGSVGALEEKLQSLNQIGAGFLYCVPLAGDVQLWAQGNVHIILALDYGGKLCRALCFQCHPPAT
jgi:hypothetical protein